MAVIVSMARRDASRRAVALRCVSIPLHFSRLSRQGGILYNGFEHPRLTTHEALNRGIQSCVTMVEGTGRVRVNGIGGVFIYSNNPKRLAEWYAQHLGIDLKTEEAQGAYYTEIWYRDIDSPRKKLHTVFAIMRATELLGANRRETMINYRVDDLEALAQQLKADGIAVEPITTQRDAEGYGKFTHLKDLDGNRIELWQPSSRES